MSDDATPTVAAGTGEVGNEALSTDAIDAILADFRAWLLEARDAAASPSTTEHAEFDVATVLQQFIALRHEVNLQTKASRNQLEQNAQTIAMLQESVGSLQQQEAMLEQNDEDVQDEVVRPLLKTLVDAHDALALAEKQVRKLLDSNLPVAGSEVHSDAPPVVKLKIPHWARWIGLDASIESQLAPLFAWHQSHRQAGPDPYRQGLEMLLTGYRMSLQRIERAFEQYGLETLTCVDEAFDPEIMEVAEVVTEAGRTRTEVIEEIRRGYRWRGKLFRCAQVRVAKG